jgi:hypothetical protein
MARKARFNAGVGKYVECDITVHIAFPEDMVICDICEFCRTENSGTRFRCLLNSKILPFHNRGIGLDCPLPIKDQLEELDMTNE